MASTNTSDSQSLISRVSMWSARHRRLIVVAWVLALVAAVAASSLLSADTIVEGSAPGETARAARLIDERFERLEESTSEFVVFQHPSLSVDDAAYQETVQGLMAELRALRETSTRTAGGTEVVLSERVVAATTTHYDTGLPPDASPFVSSREGVGDVTFAIVELLGDVRLVLDTVAAYESPEEFQILIGGDASAFAQVEDIINEDFARAGIINIPITLAILILAFGALIAAVVPLLLAFTAVFVALGVLTVISQGYSLADVYVQVVLLLGLATGIDYALFVITRYRNERRAGRDKENALRVATGTSGKAVVFAGTTTVFAVAGMFLVGDSIFSSLGLAAIVIVLIAIMSAMTLLPALIAFIGDNIDRFSIPFLNRPHAGGEGVWGWIVDRALARPRISAFLTIAVLLVFAAPIVTLNLGFNSARGLPDEAEAKGALIALEENFVLGLAQPAVVVVDAGEDGNVFADDVQASIARLMEMVEQESVLVSPDNYYGVPAQAPRFNDAGNTAMIFIPINADSGEPLAIRAVNHLRNDLVPAAFGNPDGTEQVLVTGMTAANIDFRDNIYFRTPFVFAFVLGLAFIILLLTFRSVVIALTAIFLNLLSVGFAYGLLVLVFQEGYLLEGVLSFEATGIIESWLPLFLFSILFGLSIDYEMYVMTRIKEEYERGATTQEAIARGVKSTAGVITNAAAIMVAVALVFAFTRNIALQQFGFGLAMAVLIDATVIRAFVLPTLMKILGEWNWYLPRWLNWLPTIEMAEGESAVPPIRPGTPPRPAGGQP